MTDDSSQIDQGFGNMPDVDSPPQSPTDSMSSSSLLIPPVASGDYIDSVGEMSPTEIAIEEPLLDAKVVDVDANNLNELGVDKTQLIITEQYKDLKKNPIDTVFGMLTFGTFEFYTPIVIRGFLKPLEMKDVWRLPTSDGAENLFTGFSNRYKKFLAKKYKRPALWALVSMFWFEFLIASIFKIWFDVCNLVAPIVMKYLLEFITKVKTDRDNSNWWEGLIWILVMLFLQLNSIFFTQQYFHIVLRIGMNIRSILSVAVYRKSLKLSTSERSSMTNGKITNLMSVDTQKVADIMHFLAMVYSGPLQIIFCLVALGILLWWPTVAGIVIMILLIPLQMVIFRQYAKLRTQSLVFTDSRIKSLNEVIQGIRVIKFFTYEEEYLKKITATRKQEIVKIAKLNIVRSVVSTLMSASPLLVSVSSFTLFALAYPDRLDATVIFPSLSYFILLRFPMVILPMIFASMVDSNISMKRIDDFLRREERKPIEITAASPDAMEYPIQFIDSSFEWDLPTPAPPKAPKKRKLLCIPLPGGKKKKDAPGTGSNVPGRVSISEAQEEDDPALSPGEQGDDSADVDVDVVAEVEKQPTLSKERSFHKLSNINLKVKKGELVAIIGPVGSGKSSLLNALVGEMKKVAGDIIIGSSMAYAPQTPWLMNATVQDNILFYKSFNQAKIDRVIDVCALGPDIDIFDNGILSVLGEQGINLSGGQKQRLNIARACYSDSDIVVLDDCLSAVDAHVSKHIFEKCILEYLRGKTRLLVTHQIHLCERCDRIIVMDKGEIAEVGTYGELIAKDDGLFRALSDKYLSSDKEEEKEEVEEKAPEEVQVKKAPTEVKNFMKGDERKTGSISFGILLSYMRRMGGFWVVSFVTCAFILAQLGLVSGDWWLGEWSNKTFPSVNNNAYASLGIYAALGIIAIVITLIRDWSFFLSALRASYHLHNDALIRLMKAPTSFFDTTPVGAILSRMSKDVENADTQLIVVLSQFLGTFFQVLSSIAMVAYVTRGVYLALVVVIFPIYLVIQQLYRRTSRELKRLDSISRSPLYAHFSETLTGISTIRAYRKETQFQQVNTDRMDLNQRPYFAQLLSQRWLAFRLESLGAALVTGASVLVVLLSYFEWFDISASRAGLGIVYSQTLTNVMSWCVRQLTEAETQFNAVERLLYYAKELPMEKRGVGLPVPDKSWPNGDIKFNNFEMRYREGLPLVLKGVNITIKRNEKIGVVGRTGSGKSSLLVALFRMVEAASGSIEIDGVDISQIPLKELRRKISIIPQDPLLFSGTVRSNMDPFHNKEDHEIWKALDSAGMKSTIESMGGLDIPVNEGGENFSLGQRQLLCLARALLKRSNILILDEASASIDVESDSILQQTIRETFVDNCTIITIAHRLLTIADYDKILVMDSGVEAEFDSPKNLLMEKDSIFRSLVMQTGPASALKLFELVFGKEEGTKYFNM